jgi:hypothetical protein
MKIDFALAVWGDDYVARYLDVVLPSHLAPGNLPAVAATDQPRYVVLTTPAFGGRIAASPAFARLAATVDARVECRDDVDLRERYRALSRFHAEAIRLAADDGAAIVFLSPDAVFSDGSFRALAEIARTGKSAIMITALRAVGETFLPELTRRFATGDGALAIGSRDLAALALRHLHPFVQSLFWDSPSFSGYPSNLCWRAGDAGVLIRAFHLHPLFVRTADDGVRLDSTIDDRYLSEACPSPGDLEVVTDSDRIAAVEFSTRARWEAWPPRRAGALRVACWAARNTTALHRSFLPHAIRLHADAGAGPAWDAARRASDRVVGRIAFWLRFPWLCFPWRDAAARRFRALVGERWYERARGVKRRLRGGAA